MKIVLCMYMYVQDILLAMYMYCSILGLKTKVAIYSRVEPLYIWWSPVGHESVAFELTPSRIHGQ